MTGAPMRLSELARRRGLTPDHLRRVYHRLVKSGMPPRLPGGGRWMFPRLAAEAWLAGRALPVAANDVAQPAGDLEAQRAMLRQAYGEQRRTG